VTLELYERLRGRCPKAVLECIEGVDSSILVAKEGLPEVARHLKEDGFDYLSSITGVDYPDRFEVVYHFYSTQGGGPVVIKVRASKDEPEVPSLTPLWPGADFQEREVWDLLGIRFSGHPNLKRILHWEGYQDHPLRKDFIWPPPKEG
jgi:NADH-quinone oxidoreductase subunit C/D